MCRLPSIPLLLLLVAAAPASAALRAWVDNPQVAPGETVELTLAHDGHTNTQPDLAPLRQDFDIVGRSSSSSLQIINGTASSTTQLTLTLAPKRAGRLTIPSISWDSDHSSPLTLNVTGSAGNPGGADATASRVFVETEADPKSPYVQAAVQVTVRVYTAVPLSHADLEFQGSDTVLVRQVGSDAVSTSEKNGQSYQMVTRHFLIFPQQSGHLSLPGPTLSGEVPATVRRANPNDPFSQFFGNSPFSGMLTATKPIRLNGQPIELDVQPRPAGAGANYWLPAQNLSLTAQWHPEQLQAHVGEPLTVTLHLKADDLTAAQLPDLSTLLTLPDGLKAYPDEAKLKDSANGNAVIGERDQNIALIADQPGHFTIPELRLSWWDTRTNQARQAVLPAQTLAVSPAPGSQSAAPDAASTQQTAPAPNASGTATLSMPPSGAQAADGKSPPGTSPLPRLQSAPTISDMAASQSPWKWISLGFGLLWIITLAAWFLTRRRGSSRPSASQSTKELPTSPGKSAAHTAFLSACKSNDPHAARRNLLAWANAVLPGQRIVGLNALAKVIGDAVLADLLRPLDRACYAGQPWNGTALAHALQKWPAHGTNPAESERKLAPLYH